MTLYSHTAHKLDTTDYLEEEFTSLTKKNSLSEPDVVATTLSPYLKAPVLLEQLEQKRFPLIVERNQILNLPFLTLRRKQKRRLEFIEQQLDRLESEMVGLNEEGQQRESLALQKLISDNAKAIKKFGAYT